MSAANVNDAPTAERATWDKFTEFDLLDKYLTARNDPKNATEKGLTKSAWSELIKALNEKKNRQLSKLIDEADPKQKGQIRSIREREFEHSTVCSLIAGDTRATGDEARTIEATLAEIAADKEGNGDSFNHSPTSTETNDGPDRLDEQPPRNPKDPAKRGTTKKAPEVASHQQRIDKLKRIRDRASNAKRETKKAKKEAAASAQEQAMLSFFAILRVQARRSERGDETSAKGC
ncbi:hypothetical protein PHYSODRAFT_306666 [Phytophthora sojae]|uniref:Myb/SANT-like domain-containing protein n=1 Tax=Phytophthora sojae (strain P6497) TaxID=1094619 RepID=G5AA71_PHYSP|nr:hypothetical protein PHYSODRAFT_306666 [Phytophthora sojae]EGZ07500.1 hypothetical protein PHYSODRAFT_306666 [Phytophthora sojae]|eukprot:XP_009537066.1 hypothetical protein PHYSODRAFT_306666 [Phytophthora sojae]